MWGVSLCQKYKIIGIYSGAGADVVMGGSETTEATKDATMILKEGNTILVAKVNATTPIKAGRRCFYVPPTRLKVGNYVR